MTGRYAADPTRRRLLPAVLAHIMSPISDQQNTVEDWPDRIAGAKAQVENFAAAAGPIDHVLTRNAVAASVMTIEMPGSDHRSLIATVQMSLATAAPG